MNIKKLIILLGSFIVILISVFLLTSITIYEYGEKAQAANGDCIIILGCSVYGKTPSPFLRERLNEGIRVYKAGYAHKIIVSGGKGPGETIPEAEAMESYLVKKGIDSSDIIVENNSRTTYENISNSKKIMDKNNFKSAIVVSNKYHLKRAELLCKRLNIKSSFTGVYVSEYKGDEFKGLMRETAAYLKYLMLGK